MTTSVLLADDHLLLRQALRRALEDAGLTVVGEAGDGEEAVRMAGALTPDLVVMDVSMPVLDGIEATRRLHGAAPDLPIVVLTMHGEDAVRRDAIDAGAIAFLSKDCSLQEVVATVVATLQGDVALSADLARSMLAELSAAPPSDQAGVASTAGTADDPWSPLTKREEEILQRVADGYSTAEIAQRCFISQKTVKNHLASIYDKLDARDRTQAVLSGVRIGIVRIR